MSSHELDLIYLLKKQTKRKNKKGKRKGCFGKQKEFDIATSNKINKKV